MAAPIACYCRLGTSRSLLALAMTTAMASNVPTSAIITKNGSDKISADMFGKLVHLTYSEQLVVDGRCTPSDSEPRASVILIKVKTGG